VHQGGHTLRPTRTETHSARTHPVVRVDDASAHVDRALDCETRARRDAPVATDGYCHGDSGGYQRLPPVLLGTPRTLRISCCTDSPLERVCRGGLLQQADGKRGRNAVQTHKRRRTHNTRSTSPGPPCPLTNTDHIPRHPPSSSLEACAWPEISRAEHARRPAPLHGQRLRGAGGHGA